MENALYISLSRQTALRRELAVVANNVANVNTASFKRELSIYETYPQKVKGGDTLAFVIDRGTATSYAPGPIQATDSAFDLAIAGPGFFAVDNGKGTHYTRNGSFRLDHENRLVTQDNNPVLDASGKPIVAPVGTIKIDVHSDGSIKVDGEIIGVLQLVEFQNVQVLERRGNSLYETDQPPLPAENSQILQGAVEGSNVQAVKELVRLIDIQRAYDGVKLLMDKEAERQKTSIQRLSRAPTG